MMMVRAITVVEAQIVAVVRLTRAAVVSGSAEI
jgi:hypothetical protein